MLDRWKALAIEAAIEAGIAILQVYESDFTVLSKEDQSPVTIADLKAHELLLKKLEKTDLPILSEEGEIPSFEIRKKWSEFWMIDPLDGTREFVNRSDDFTVNIAFLRNNQPVFGVIYIPIVDTVYFGGATETASYKIEKPSLSSSWREYLEQATTLKNNPNRIISRVLVSKSHLNEETQNYVSTMMESDTEIHVIKRGSSLKFCLLAEGSADLYPRFSPCMEWDTAAGDAICEGVGVSIFKAKTKNKLSYNKISLANPNFEAY